jgi:hypothetical protein
MQRGKVLVIIAIAVVVVLFVLAFALPEGERDSIVTQYNLLEEPFELRAWVIDADGVTLDIGNVGSEDLVVNSVSVIDCGGSSYGGMISAGDSRLFEIPCELDVGTEFRSNISVSYSVSGSQEELVINGRISDLV